MEDSLISQEQELERMKNQHDKILKEIQMVLDQNSILERQISENCYAEKELEEKIIQAVELLIRFKEKRDMLLIERDIAVKKAHQFRKLVKENEACSRFSQSFYFSFLDIIEATQNFDPSSKMSEGRFGSVYRGIIRHTEVAIRMLPSCGSQSDPEFSREVNIYLIRKHDSESIYMWIANLNILCCNLHCSKILQLHIWILDLNSFLKCDTLLFVDENAIHNLWSACVCLCILYFY